MKSAQSFSCLACFLFKQKVCWKSWQKKYVLPSKVLFCWFWTVFFKNNIPQNGSLIWHVRSDSTVNRLLLKHNHMTNRSVWDAFHVICLLFLQCMQMWCTDPLCTVCMFNVHVCLWMFLGECVYMSVWHTCTTCKGFLHILDLFFFKLSNNYQSMSYGII